MIYMLFIDADSVSIMKISDLIHGKLTEYGDSFGMEWDMITDSNHTLVVAYRRSENENKNPRTYIIITYSINEYNDENRSNYNQRGVMRIETDDIDKYVDIMNMINNIIQSPRCKIEELHPMAYMDEDYEPVELISEDIKSVYLKFTCSSEEDKHKPGE
jgi:predicted type IV restriction endonuclease